MSGAQMIWKRSRNEALYRPDSYRAFERSCATHHAAEGTTRNEDVPTPGEGVQIGLADKVPEVRSFVPKGAVRSQVAQRISCTGLVTNKSTTYSRRMSPQTRRGKLLPAHPPPKHDRQHISPQMARPTQRHTAKGSKALCMGVASHQGTQIVASGAPRRVH
eukprot:6184607-Pleurochrysis_carterae.AAC.3